MARMSGWALTSVIWPLSHILSRGWKILMNWFKDLPVNFTDLYTRKDFHRFFTVHISCFSYSKRFLLNLHRKEQLNLKLLTCNASALFCRQYFSRFARFCAAYQRIFLDICCTSLIEPWQEVDINALPSSAGILSYFCFQFDGNQK